MKIKLFFFLLFIGCSSQKDIQIRHLEEYYQSAGVEQYLLTDLPEWANFFQAGSCHRSKSMKFFNIDKVVQSFSLSYLDAVQFQYAFNVKLWEQNKNNPLKDYQLKDYQFLFYDVFKQVNGGKKEYRVPEYAHISVYWGDGHWQDPKFKKIILTQMQTKDTLPVFVSGCLSASEVKEKLLALGLGDLSEYIISQELFSAGELGYYIHLKKLLKADHIELYVPGGKSAQVFSEVEVIKEY